jgi:hypothetical protein
MAVDRKILITDPTLLSKFSSKNGELKIFLCTKINSPRDLFFDQVLLKMDAHIDEVHLLHGTLIKSQIKSQHSALPSAVEKFFFHFSTKIIVEEILHIQVLQISLNVHTNLFNRVLELSKKFRKNIVSIRHCPSRLHLGFGNDSSD